MSDSHAISDRFRKDRQRHDHFLSDVIAEAHKEGTVTTLSTAWTGIRGAAQFLGVSCDTVYKLVHAGQIRSARVGRQFRISVAELEAFLASGGSR